MSQCICTWQPQRGLKEFHLISIHRECPVHQPGAVVPQGGTYLSVQARALAVHVAAFNDLVARDANTHDGDERGENWIEPIHNHPSFGDNTLRTFDRALRDLADLWDFG